MSVQITINGADSAEALQELGGLARGLLGSTSLTPSTGAEMAADAMMRSGGDKTTADTVKTLTPAEKPARGRGRPKADPAPADTGSGQAISTGGERVDPEKQAGPDPEPEAPKVVEPEKQADPEPKADEPLTLDDVRKAATPYIDKHTLVHAQVDLQDCLEDAVGGGLRTISQLDPNNQEQLKKARDAFIAAGLAGVRYVKKTSVLG